MIIKLTFIKIFFSFGPAEKYFQFLAVLDIIIFIGKKTGRDVAWRK